MRGYFDPVDSLLDIAFSFCVQNHADSEFMLFDSYWVLGGTRLQLNDFEAGALAYEQAYNILQQAVSRGIIPPNDDRIAIASGLMGNGKMALNQFADAERWYLRAFQIWDDMDDDVFLDKQLFVSTNVASCSDLRQANDKQVANITICLAAQGKLQEAEELLLPKLRNRENLKGFK
jgi:hypothetical protein